MIELGFYPESTLCYAPAKTDKDYKDYIVIPTCPSTSERLANALEKLDLKALEKHLESAMDGIAKLVNNPDLTASIRALKDTLQDARKLVTKVDRQVDPLADNVKKTVKDFGKLAANVDSRVGGLATGLDNNHVRGQRSPFRRLTADGRIGEHAAGDFRHEQVNSAVDQLS